MDIIIEENNEIIPSAPIEKVLNVSGSIEIFEKSNIELVVPPPD